MLCKKCGKELPEGSLYCCWCGKKQETVKRKTHRRPKGQGTISVDKRYRKPYIARGPKSPGGLPGTYIGSFATYAEASEAIIDYCRNGRPDYYEFTLAQIYELWSKVHYAGLTKNGELGYRAAYNYLDPLKPRKMRELKTADYQSCIDRCSEKFGRDKCAKIKQLCSQLCKYAMENDVIDKNYAQFIRLPKPAARKEKETFTLEEIGMLWKNSDDRRAQIVLFMIYMGYRIGEVAQIRKADVDLEEMVIYGGIKSEAGKNRAVPVCNERLADFVREWYKTSETELLLNETVDNLRDKVFYSLLADLGMIDPPIKNEKTKKMEYKHPRLTPHCTRHTFATLGKLAGVAPEDLQKLIGHAKYETTAEIYIHEDMNDLKTAMSLLQGLGVSVA